MNKNKVSEKIPCIVLNKSFIGSYIDKEDQDAHEIINFLKADDGKNYVYCNPYGQNVANAENYDIQYFVVTTDLQNDSFYLEYLYEIKKTLHTKTYSRKYVNEEYKDERHALITEAIEQINKSLSDIPDSKTKSISDIKYNGIEIKDFFPDQVYTIPVTYIAEKVYKAKDVIKIEQVSNEEDNKLEYNFQRNFGYVTEIKARKTYNKILTEIENKKNWEEVIFSRADFKNIPKSKNTFLNLIGMHREEECYTRILGNLLSIDDDNIKEDIIKKLLGKIEITKLDSFDFSEINVTTEFSIDDKKKDKCGRIDLLIQGQNFNIIIENKIDSGINYITTSDNNEKLNQLQRYYNFFQTKYEASNNIYLVLVPNNRIMSPEIKTHVL